MWGDGSGGTTTYFIKNPPNNQDVMLVVFGRITAAQDVGVGNYTDTVVVTLEVLDQAQRARASAR